MRGIRLAAGLSAMVAVAGCGASRGRAAAPDPTVAPTSAATTPIVAPTAASPTTAVPTTAVPTTRPAVTTTSTVAHPRPVPSTPSTTAARSAQATPPPYQVGETTLALVDASRPTVSGSTVVSRSRALTTMVWYPLVSGRRPLVMFAHGFDVNPQTYLSLLEAWASHGYVVAAPEFPLTDNVVAGSYLYENDIVNQPQDVRFVADTLISPAGPLASRIDPSRIAVTGHSDGGQTALSAGIDPVPAGEPAYRAVIAMSIQPAAPHTDNPPILITQGDTDTINPPDLGYQAWDDAVAPKYLLILKGGGHLPPLLAGSAYLPGVEAVTEAFLDAYLASDGPAGALATAVGGSPLFTLRSG
jgi:predicted esterase